ncbi:MAG: hypothetical protein GY938_16495 [Ketobacter sp.]|nr:hypothetical protein [Ketobacter sp.]
MWVTRQHNARISGILGMEFFAIEFAQQIAKKGMDKMSAGASCYAPDPIQFSSNSSAPNIDFYNAYFGSTPVF